MLWEIKEWRDLQVPAWMQARTGDASSRGGNSCHLWKEVWNEPFRIHYNCGCGGYIPPRFFTSPVDGTFVQANGRDLIVPGGLLTGPREDALSPGIGLFSTFLLDMLLLGCYNIDFKEE